MNELEGLAKIFLESKKNKDQTYNKKFTYAKLNKTFETIFEIKDNFLFEKIILADKKEMENYIILYKNYLSKKGFELKSIEILQKENKRKKLFKELLSLYKYYDSFRSEWNKKIVNAVDTRTCLYCNREYVISYTDENNEKTTAELDHFYPRSLYPFLSISFFNLIPSCKICNSRLKGDKDTFKENILYPYQESLNENMYFKLQIDSVDFINQKNKFSLNLETKSKKANESKELFKLEKLYQEHKDIVLELIQKAEIYNDSYIDELMQNYEGTLFKNREDLLRLITCGYVTDEDINKRPLSKLIKDISEELELT